MANVKPAAGEEQAWIRLCQQGQTQVFGQLVARHQGLVFSVIYHIVGRPAETEDLAQEVFIKAFQAIGSFNFQASFAAWLTRIAVNHCYDYLRRVKVSRVSYHWQMSEEQQQLLEETPQDVKGAPADGERRAVLKDLVTKLLERAPAGDRVMLVLKEVEGLSVAEIGEVLKLRESAVKVRLHRARKRMLDDYRKLMQRG